MARGASVAAAAGASSSGSSKQSKSMGGTRRRLSGMDAAKLCQESAHTLYSTKNPRSPAKYLRNSPRRRRNRRRRLSSRRPATELLSGLGMSAPPSTPPSTSPEGATASGTIAGVFVTLAAAAVLAYSMVVQRHARRSRPRPVWPGCRRGPSRLSGRGRPKPGAARVVLGRCERAGCGRRPCHLVFDRVTRRRPQP